MHDGSLRMFGFLPSFGSLCLLLLHAGGSLHADGFLIRFGSLVPHGFLTWSGSLLWFSFATGFDTLLFHDFDFRVGSLDHPGFLS